MEKEENGGNKSFLQIQTKNLQSTNMTPGGEGLGDILHEHDTCSDSGLGSKWRIATVDEFQEHKSSIFNRIQNKTVNVFRISKCLVRND